MKKKHLKHFFIATAPKEVVLLSSILERCAQLLPQSNDERLDTALLHTIGLSVALLSAHEDVLLPKVHRLWDPLRHQLLQSRSPLKQVRIEIVLVIRILGKAHC